MLSLSQFRTHLFPVFNLMRNTGDTFEVVSKGVVYDVYVRRTQKVPQLSRPKRETSHEVVSIQTAECEACGSLMFNSVCMNTKCPSLIQAV